MSHTDPSGRAVSELFQKLPSKVVSPTDFRYYCLNILCHQQCSAWHKVCFLYISFSYMDLNESWLIFSCWHLFVIVFRFLVTLFCLFQHYPDYYAIIKEPIDLRAIAQRIQVTTSLPYSLMLYIKTYNKIYFKTKKTSFITCQLHHLHCTNLMNVHRLDTIKLLMQWPRMLTWWPKMPKHTMNQDLRFLR